MNFDLESLSVEELRGQLRKQGALLEQVSQMWRRTVDAIDEPIILIDAAFGIQRSNQAAALEAGCSIRELLGQRCHSALFKRETPCSSCPLKEQGQAPRQAELELEGRIWEVTTWRFPEEEGSAVCRYQEVTQSRALQKKVLLYAKLAAVGELAGCVAHELNNPLTGILSFSQLIAQNMVDFESTRELAGDIEREAQRCSRIVQSLLDYARPGSNAEMGMVSLLDISKECIDLVQLQIPSHSEIKIQLNSEELPLIEGQADALKSLILNLLTNAIQASPLDGMIWLNLRILVEELEICIEDQGSGIPMQLLEGIFEPFFSTKAKNKEGTGLGLAIVKNVVDLHGGQVWAENRTEGGARFNLRLPLRLLP